MITTGASRRFERMSVAWAIVASVGVCGETATAQPRQASPPVVSEVDLARYAGRWFELGRLPFRFERQCASDVTADYALRPDGRVDVVNACRTEDGGVNRAKGVARVVSNDGSNAKLEVRFAPAVLSFIPAVWGDYWILDLAPDYSTVLVGTPDRKYLWILARTPVVDDGRYAELLARAATLGYDVGRVQPTRHTPAS
jgi:apolipoprotein D and lipocalin family protein